MDYEDDVKYMESCKTAAAAGISINTIQCGTISTTEPIWSDIARKAEGRYFRVEQSGGAILAATPFDGDLAAMSKKLDATRVYYGGKEYFDAYQKHLKQSEKIYRYASSRALAQRLAFNDSAAGTTNWVGAGLKELLNDFEAGDLKFEELKDEERPEELRGKSAEECTAWIKTKLEERKKIQAQVAELAKKREAHLKAQIEKSGDTELDKGVYDCIREQAARKGIVYSGGPKH